MNKLVAMGDNMTMGTREISEMLNCKHSDLKRSADRLVKAAAINGGAPLADTPYINEQNQQTYYEYRLCRIDSITLVAQNCPQFTAALVKRWDDLERGVSQPSFMKNLSQEALIMLNDLSNQLEAARPKIEAFDRVMDRENLINATQVAQQVGISAIKLNKHLDAIGGVYNKAVKRGRVFCQSWIDGGYGEMKQTDQGFPQTLFTTKGSMRIIEMLTSEGII